MRVINGYDSFGNTCGVKKNEHYTNFPLSGLNTIDRPKLFYFDLHELKQSIKICVKECPKRNLNNPTDLYKYYEETQITYCRYDFNMTILVDKSGGNLEKFFNYLGPCPSLPVRERYRKQYHL